MGPMNGPGYCPNCQSIHVIMRGESARNAAMRATPITYGKCKDCGSSYTWVGGGVRQGGRYRLT